MAQEIVTPPSSNTDNNETLSKDDILDLLSTDAPEVEVTEDLLAKAPAKEDKEEDDKEEIKLEGVADGEEEEKPEIDEEEIEVHTPPARKQILAKYPTLFKEFPYLERAMYKSQEFTEIFPTLRDAREAVDKVQSFEKFESTLLSGSTEDVLKAVKGTDEKAFGKIVDNYLEALNKTDPGAFTHVMNNIAKNTIQHVWAEGMRLENDKVKEAAIVLNQLLFGGSQFIPPQKFAKEERVDPQKQQLDAERRQFATERFNNTYEDLSRRTDNIIKSTIDQHMDPKGVMTDYVKRNAVKDCMSEVESLIGNDTRFRNIIDNLWENAAKHNFSKKETDKIRSAYLSKVQTLLPQLIQKTRNEALKGLGRGSSNKSEQEKDRKGPLPKGPSTSRNSGSQPKSTGKGMSTYDFFNSD